MRPSYPFGGLFIRLLLGGLIPMILLGLIWFGANVYFLDFNKRALDVRDSAGRLQLYLLQMRNAEKDFLLSDKSDFYRSGATIQLTKRQAALNDLQRELEKLKKIVPSNTKESVEKVHRLIKKYDKIFLQLMGAYRQKGSPNRWFWSGFGQVEERRLQTELRKLDEVDPITEKIL